MDRRHLLSTGMVLALGAMAPAVDSAGAAAAPANAGLLINGLSGNTIDKNRATGTFSSASLLIQKVGLDNETRTLKVYGLVTGTYTDSGGTPHAVKNKPVVAIATLASGIDGSRARAPSCSILNLILGPLHLNVLGLVIDLNQVVLNITGQTGVGELLGNLLCGLAGLLDPGLGPLGQITQQLNQINKQLPKALGTLTGGG